MFSDQSDKVIQYHKITDLQVLLIKHTSREFPASNPKQSIKSPWNIELCIFTCMVSANKLIVELVLLQKTLYNLNHQFYIFFS